MGDKGRIFVVSAPSGAGKRTLILGLREMQGAPLYAVSATTRPPRPDEVEGKDYFFLSEDAFLEKRDAGDFVEWAQVHGNYYGTLWSELERLTATGKDVLLELDVQGMRQVRGENLDAICIFIMPPSLAELERRLRERGVNSDDDMALRLSNARDEMTARDEYDHIVINDDADRATEELKDIVRNCSAS